MFWTFQRIKEESLPEVNVLQKSKLDLRQQNWESKRTRHNLPMIHKMSFLELFAMYSKPSIGSLKSLRRQMQIEGS